MIMYGTGQKGITRIESVNDRWVETKGGMDASKRIETEIGILRILRVLRKR